MTDYSNLLDIAAPAMLQFLEERKALAVGRLIAAYRAKTDTNLVASEISVYEELITSFKQKLIAQKDKGVPNVTRS